MLKNRRLLSRSGGAAVFVLMCFLVSSANAQPYAIDWWTVDDGGIGTSSAGSYVLTGTAGQCDASGMSGAGDYRLVGGYWPGSGMVCWVDLPELAALTDQWLGAGSADLDGSGTVDLTDYAMLAGYWLQYCPPGWSF